MSRRLFASAVIFAALSSAVLSGIVIIHLSMRIQRVAEEAAHHIADPELVRLELRLDQLEVVAGALAADVDAAHARIGDVQLAADAVVATCPGRARTPQIPKRTRPCPSAKDLLTTEVPDGR